MKPIESTVISLIKEIAGERELDLPPLTSDVVLVETGLDSLGIAILVARLEDALGIDPFTASDEFPSIVTLGDFIRFYEDVARSTHST
jgi:acyl carrier protein